MATSSTSRLRQAKTISNSSSTTSGGGTTTRKMKIKPFKRPPSLPPDFYDRISSVLLSATRAILRHEPLYTEEITTSTGISSKNSTTPPVVLFPGHSPTSAMLAPHHHSNNNNNNSIPNGNNSRNNSIIGKQQDGQQQQRRPIGREELYKSVEDLCVHKHGAKLYDAVVKAMDEGAMESVGRLCETAGAVRVQGPNGCTQIGFSSLPTSDNAMPILSAVRKVYSDYSDYLFFVRSIFLYLDRSYVLHSGPSTKSLWEVGIDCFRRHMTMATTTRTTTMASPTSDSTFMDISSMEGSSKNTHTVAASVVQCILHLIRRERDGEAIDRPLLRDVLRMLAELNLYKSLFIPKFLSTSAAYYEVEGKRVMDRDGDVPSFLRHVECRLSQCQEACVGYLDCYDSGVVVGGAEGGGVSAHGTRKALLSVVENHLLKPHVDIILQPKNCYPLFSDPDRIIPDLKRMFILINRIHFTKDLKIAFFNYAKQAGMEIVHEKSSTGSSTSSSSASEKEIVPKLLRLKQDLSNAHTQAFDSKDEFNNAIKDAFEHFLNSRGNKPSELLARYVDHLLKSTKRDKTLEGGDAETALDQVMILFRHLHSKDVFEAFFQKDLARRLLHNKSSSVDLERSFLSKLKAECGSNYTSKMEGMFKDMDLSRDIMANYAEHVRDKFSSVVLPSSLTPNAPPPSPTTRIEMDVQILTTGYWPQYPQYKSIKLPHDLQVHISRFETYYDNKYQGRRIHWQYSLCNCNVKANFPEKKLDLMVNLYQALVLLCFNDVDGLTLPQIQERTGIEERGELERVLQSLSLGKIGTRVLLKVNPPVPAGEGGTKSKKHVSDTDIFRYNVKFTNKLSRVKIPQIQAREVAQLEQSKIHEAVARDRQYLIDAAIVRIMKARKTIQHRDLMGEVMNQIKGVSRPTSTEIKKRLEGLMEREYLERDENNKAVYNYLA